MVAEFEYRGVDTVTGEYYYRVRVSREGYSWPNGSQDLYWTPRIADITGINWVHDNLIAVTSDRPGVVVDWQVPQASAWTAQGALVRGKIKWTWDAER